MKISTTMIGVLFLGVLSGCAGVSLRSPMIFKDTPTVPAVKHVRKCPDGLNCIQDPVHDGIFVRLDRLETEMSVLGGRVDSLEQKVGNLMSQLTGAKKAVMEITPQMMTPENLQAISSSIRGSGMEVQEIWGTPGFRRTLFRYGIGKNAPFFQADTNGLRIYRM